MGIRYIGSKARVAQAILNLTGSPTGGRFVDAFVGTGAVAREAAIRGWEVSANDHLLSSAVLAGARLLSVDKARFAEFGGYKNAIAELNATPGHDGFITREYSPASIQERKYFTVENARRIDAVRAKIRGWSQCGAVTRAEEMLLISDLLIAANTVANTAGTYGCFLSAWSDQALRPLGLIVSALLPPGAPSAEITVGDVADVATLPEDTVYLDPPYTKRQYAAYYHIQETIAQGDEPVVEGVTGLRPWRHLASDYCYKRRALPALEALIAAMPARRVLLSYSSEGHMTKADIVAMLGNLGDVEPHTLGPIGRYRPNSTATLLPRVHEYLFELIRPAVAVPVREAS